MNFWREVRLPPDETNWDGAPRRVGVELEFAAVSARDGAGVVQSLFGGFIREEDPHRFHISGTKLGDFVSELDTQFAHRGLDETENVDVSEDPFGRFLIDFRAGMRRIYGNISSLVVPCEIVCPPVAIDNLPQLDLLVSRLTEAGAQGTRLSPLYAFGAQFNPDIASKESTWLTAILKSYLLLSDWLRSVMVIDTTRRLVAFADPFPLAYVDLVTAEDYWPECSVLIDDYLDFNPTRNRELDLLPLFAWLDPDRVQARLSDERIKPRPALHYRLPDANLGVQGWTLILEWNRWVVVERLAQNRELLTAMGAAYRENRSRLLPEDWAMRSSEWLVLGTRQG